MLISRIRQIFDDNHINFVDTGQASRDTTSKGFFQEISLSKDEIFHILQNKRRRHVLQYLADTDGPVKMRDISEQIAAWEYDTTVQQLTSDQRKRVYIALYQTHLPKLADSSLITYNQSRGIVKRTAHTDQIISYLNQDYVDRSEDTETEWVLYYVGVTGLSMLLIVTIWASSGPLTLLSDVGFATVIILLYAAVTAVRAVKIS